MKSILFAIALASCASAHAIFQEFWVGTTDKNVSCNRMPRSNSPVTNVGSNDIACNTGTAASPGTCTAEAGTKITVEMHQQPGDRNCKTEAIGGQHYGPVMVYFAKSCQCFNGIRDLPLHGSRSQKVDWIMENGLFKLNDNCGKWELTIPKSIPSGDYLVRAEVIALHAAGSSGGAQFYMSCYQLSVTGGGNASPATVKFPGAYSAKDPGILINIHQDLKSYTIPGPPVFQG